MKCVDAHLHIFERLTGYAFGGEFRPIGGGMARWASGDLDLLCTPDMGDTGVSAESMIRFMDRHEIETGVLLQACAYGFQNEYIAESVEKYPDRLVGTATIDPFFRMFDKILDRFVGELNFRRFKLEMSCTGGLCSFHDENALWNHENLEKLCARLESLNGTLSLDLGAPGTPSHRIDRVKQIAQAHPNLHIIICHLLSMPRDHAQQLQQELEYLNLGNIWFDLAAINSNTAEHAPFEWARRYHRIAKDTVGAKKLVWGTDSATVMKDFTYEELMSLVTDAGTYSDAELSDIFRNNAREAYRF